LIAKNIEKLSSESDAFRTAKIGCFSQMVRHLTRNTFGLYLQVSRLLPAIMVVRKQLLSYRVRAKDFAKSEAIGVKIE